jgi:uncharacterized membrane protein
MKAGMEWHFGGWLHGQQPVLAWGLLGLIAIVGLGLITLSYQRTLRKLPTHARWGLTLLRTALLAGILLCLANPVRVDDSDKDKKAGRKLVVLVDRSASMDAIDNRQETRLGNALRAWRQHSPEAKEKFDQIEYIRFSTNTESFPNLDDAAKQGKAGEETHLLDAIQQTLASSPAAIVCLTDGLDTTQKDPSEITSLAQRSGIPLYFVAANNRARPGEFLNIKEIKSPSQVLRQTRFPAAVIVEAVAARDTEIPVELWSRDQKLSESKFKVRAGWNSIPWTVEVAAEEIGPMPLEFRVGSLDRQEYSASTTRIIDKTTVDILYYQGALQWGYRFLQAALQSDPSFQMASILNPALGMKMTAPAQGHAVLNDLPENADELKSYQIVVLAHAFADQLSDKQQQALIEYVRGGGGILFITPDSNASQDFAGTAIEEMLPVVFERRHRVSQEDAAAQTFQLHMQAIGGARSPDETAFAEEAMSRQEIEPLTPFAALRSSSRAKLFAPGPNAPQFSEYAKVLFAKPGAEIIAVHPRDRSPNGTPRVLIARQQFGQGFAAAMTTDLLWRWKLSLPSSARNAETFWQQFMLSLASKTPGQGLRIVRLGDSPSLSRPVTVRVEGSNHGEPPKISATTPRGVALPLVARGSNSKGTWDASFTPDQEGRWEIAAENSSGDIARISLPVSQQGKTVETVNTPADIEGMRQLAEATGGTLIDKDSAAFPSPSGDSRSMDSKRTRPLWDESSLLLLLLGFYATELVTRRCYRLL